MPDPKFSFTQKIPENLRKFPEKARAVGAVFVFRIAGDNGGVWTVDMKNQIGVSEGEREGADCIIEVASEDWTQMTENPNSAMNLYFQGKLKVTGNAMLALKLQPILS